MACRVSHVFSKFQVLKHKFTLQKQNKLSKAQTDRINVTNSNEERYLGILNFIKLLPRYANFYCSHEGVYALFSFFCLLICISVIADFVVHF